MLRILTTDGIVMPVVICDYCGERISNAGLAAAVTSNEDPDAAGTVPVLHVHKGECFDAVEQRSGGQIGWEELSRHLRLVLHNVQLTVEQLAEDRDQDVQFGITNE